MDISPTADIVIIKPLERKAQTRGGIYLPEVAADSNLREGLVVDVGPGAFSLQGIRIPLEDIHSGDVIIYNAQVASQTIVEEGEEYLMIKAAAILGYRPSSRNQEKSND